MLVVLVALTALAGACLQATTGMGFALVLTPVMFALLSPVGAITAVTLLGLALNILVLFGEGRRPLIAWREVAPILIAVAPGTVCGVLVLRALPKPALQVVVGTLVMAAVAVRVLATTATTTAEVAAPGNRSSMRLAVGFATGALTTSAGVSGPPLALWLSRCRLGPGQLRDSLSAMFLA
ncbi:MAG TPA: sulfite exporter TauE/SafE family protein, partial [Thermoleophilaceae bacterium]